MSTSTPPKKKKNILLYALLGLLVVVIIAAVIKIKQKPRGTAVTIEKAEIRQVNETVTASGKIYPVTEVKISSDVSGEIVELYVEEGDSVIAGQILAKIDPEAYISSVARGEASLNSSKSQLAISKANLITNQAQKEQIVAQLENAKAIYNRNEGLRKEGVISQADLEQSLSSLQALQANLRSAEAGIKSGEQNIKASEFAIKGAEANLNELKTSLNRTTIKAPISGIVSRLLVEKGERVVGTIQMTGTEMMRISNLNSMEVQVDVSENDILKVEIGDTADIEVDAYIDKKFKGIVTQIANSASNLSSTTGVSSLTSDQVTNFIVKIQILATSYENFKSEKNPYPLRPGMSASVDIYTQMEKKLVTVPIQAVSIREKENSSKNEDISSSSASKDEYDEVVFIMEADTARMIIVKTGIQDDTYITIKEGLQGSEQVVTGPYNVVSKKLKNGDKIRLKEEDKKEEESTDN